MDEVPQLQGHILLGPDPVGTLCCQHQDPSRLVALVWEGWMGPEQPRTAAGPRPRASLRYYRGGIPVAFEGKEQSPTGFTQPPINLDRHHPP